MGGKGIKRGRWSEMDYTPPLREKSPNAGTYGPEKP